VKRLTTVGIMLFVLAAFSGCAFGESFIWTVSGGNFTYTGTAGTPLTSGSVAVTGLTLTDGVSITATCNGCTLNLLTGFGESGVFLSGLEVNFAGGTFDVTGTSLTIASGPHAGTYTPVGGDVLVSGTLATPTQILGIGTAYSTSFSTLAVDPTITSASFNSSVVSAFGIVGATLISSGSSASFAGSGTNAPPSTGFNFTPNNILGDTSNLSFDLSVSPEPVTFLLFGSGLLATMLFRRRAASK